MHKALVRIQQWKTLYWIGGIAIVLVILPRIDPDNLISRSYEAIKRRTPYLVAGTVLEAVSVVSRIGYGITLATPWKDTAGSELLLLGEMTDKLAQSLFAQAWKGTPFTRAFFSGQKVLCCEYSWKKNAALLSQLSATNEEEKELLLFLQRRWLSKSTGFYHQMVQWVCPCFGIDLQAHPETNSSYARNPSNALLTTYNRRVEHWKQHLPHPETFPLLLTRPADIQKYLPPSIRPEEIDSAIINLLEGKKIVIDCTDLVQSLERKEWLQLWNQYQIPLSRVCLDHHLDPDQILCIERLREKEIGGIRLLPLGVHSPQQIKKHNTYLLEWISLFGLTANRVELDRCFTDSCATQVAFPMQLLSQKEFLNFLNSYEYTGNTPQKTVLIQGMLKVLKGLFTEPIDLISSMKSSIAEIEFFKIRENLLLIAQEDKPLFDTALKLEEVHASISALLEVYSPYIPSDFSTIYHNLLHSIPSSLLPLTACGIHSSGMSSTTGILKATEQYLGRKPRVIYGENTYFETVFAARAVSDAIDIELATEDHWKEIDLLLTQFNPVLRRIDGEPTVYKEEQVSSMVRQALKERQEPLTVAIDCTLDFINSTRIATFLKEFHQEIESGLLNVISFRSGLKFDLFGMDNYCGAPLYMIHDCDPKWAPFSSLFTDPVLQADRLSLNWFCLAYKYSASELEAYRKQTFDNTRSLLDRIPQRLFQSEGVHYRVVPMLSDVDPAYIDIRVTGPQHQFKAANLVGGTLVVECMRRGHPLFFRPSLGFYHPNYTMLFSKNISTIRLTLGIDPGQVDVLVDCFKMIDDLNGKSDSNSRPLANKSQSF